MEVLANKNYNTLESLNSINASNSSGGLLGNLLLKSVQQETYSIMHQLIDFYLSHQTKKIFLIESFYIEIAAPQYDSDKLTTIESINITPNKQCISLSNSQTNLESPNQSNYQKRNIEEDNLKCLNDIDFELDIKKKNETIELSKRYSYSTSPDYLIKKKKIKGFNFRNKIEFNENNCYQSKKNKNSLDTSLHNNESTFAQPCLPTNRINNSKPNIKPQIKQYWNVSKANPSIFQQKIIANMTKLISSRKLLE